ncbi:uncharacterized protein [Triticum aestivum]|uniref:uncharacterized protein n=1 Tax=Triticum aestivum TaxID=4565 RepID=UPI001D0047A6|nr:uncharacterized protein LOC123142723 [Triticum aestivum]
MARIPRRLRDLNLTMHDAEHVQLAEENLQGPPEIDNIVPGRSHESTSQIKIIWPNGEMRQIVGEFRLKNLSQVHGGKIIVETNEKGVPNERSGSILSSYLSDVAENSTFAPLNIPRWDNELFVQRKNNMIKDVEEKFVYPSETKQLTRDWVLMTKLCEKNTECAKQQKNPHTTGRKSHARLQKEMEIKRKAPIHKIDLWDEAHKKKDGNYTSDNVKTIMDAANEELKKRKIDHNGSLSIDDYTEAFKGALDKRAKLRGYYDEKYWSGVNVSQGITFVGKSDQENLQFEVRMVKDNVEDVKDDVEDVKGDVKEVKGDVGDVRGQMAMIAAFLAKKFPGEICRNEVDSPTENYQVTPHDRDNNLQSESYNVLEQSNNDVQEPQTTMQVM